MKEIKRYKYNMSFYCIVVTWVVVSIVAFLLLFLGAQSSGTYLTAWLLSLIGAIFIFCFISFPRSLRLYEDRLEVSCILELYTLEYCDITKVYRADKAFMNSVIPIFSSLGFGGHYGYYFDLRELRFLKFYATNFSDLIVIENIYQETYVVSCSQIDEFIKIIERQKNINNKGCFNT